MSYSLWYAMKVSKTKVWIGEKYTKGGYVYYININNIKTEDEWLKTFKVVEKAVNDSQKK